MKWPIRKLLVLINQSTSRNLIYFAYKYFELKKQVYTKYIRNKMQEAMFPDIDFSNFSSFIFKVHRIFIEKEDYPSEKVVIDEEELDGIDKDG